MKKRMLKSESLKGRFFKFILLMMILLLSIAGLSHYANFQSLERYNRTFNSFDQLLSFYRNIESMSASTLNYIYTGNSVEFKDYEKFRDGAKQNIGNLQERVDEELQFRYTLLENMVDFYDEHINQLVLGDTKTFNQRDYDFFLRLKDLIMDTYPSYTRLVTNHLKIENVQLERRWHQQLYLTLTVSGILIIMSILFVINYTKSITGPIDTLIKNMDLIKQGEFNIEKHHSNCIEISTLLSSFSEMAKNVDKNIRNIQETTKMERHIIEVENENLRISQLLTEAQLVALQHQMNPHFLFNTLSTISKLAYLEGAQKSYDLMMRTAHFLRYGLDMGNKTSNLSLEINSIESYFEIQKIRMGERVKFSLEVSDNFSQVSMPGMILQPLIENCIIHGVQDKIGSSFISVQAFQRGNRAIVVVEDDGIGINESLLEELNNSHIETTYGSSVSVNEKSVSLETSAKLKEDKRMHLGIQNVRKRLSLYFKDNFSLFFESEVGCGTVVTLDLPMNYEGVV